MLKIRQEDPSTPIFDRGDISFIIVCSALVSFMIPGLGFLYAGLARRKSALQLIWTCAAANAVVIFQWFFWGYSLAFSNTATNGFIGNLQHFAMRDGVALATTASPGSPLLPELLYSLYQMEFACVTVVILMGAVAERGRVLPAMVFTFLWTTLVYCPVACWVWGANGWALRYGVLDYAGGGPVEIGSGFGGLAYAWVLGRRQPRELLNFRPHNVSIVSLGTFILWFGWLGFNAGSSFGANLRAVLAAWNTNICAAMGGVTWCLLDFRLERKWTAVGFCSGTIAGLVAATPASGYIPLWASVVLGVVTGAVCNYGTKIKFYLKIDDALDLFAEHAVGGIVGLIFNALFADSALVALDGVTVIPGGWLNRHWRQLYIQIAYIVACSAYVFVVTALLAKLVDMIPGLKLSAGPEAEALGMDEHQIGEFASDYIEIRRDFLDWTSPSTEKLSRYTQPDTGKEPPVPETLQLAGDRHGRPDTSPNPVSAPRESESKTGESVSEGDDGAIIEKARR